MLRRRARAATVCLATLCVALGGCGAAPADAAPDAVDDVDAIDDAPDVLDAPDGREAGAVDARLDAVTDVTRDASVDAPRDAPLDAPRDASVDAPRDAPVDAAPDVPTTTPVDIDAVPWVTLGTGVAVRDLGAAAGAHAFIGYGGYGVTGDWTRAWVTQLWRVALRARGVRYVYAVQGPADVLYRGLEIGNSRLAMHLVPRVTDASRVLVAAHSSGSYVAHELLQQLFEGGLDPAMRTWHRLAYWNLDGGTSGLDATIAGRVARMWFVWSRDARTGTRSPNNDSMLAGAARYPDAGGAVTVDATSAGCNADAVWCLHMTVITQRPHNPAGSSVMLDYASFDAAHAVATSWLDITWARLP